MLQFNPQILTDRGIKKPNHFLRQCGFSYTTAVKLLQSQPTDFRITAISQLCLKLNCTPNDLFTHTPIGLPPNHALHQLAPTTQPDLQTLIQTLTPQQIQQLKTQLTPPKDPTT